ncbi:MAG TPA: hypothetical protein DIT04_13595, partial [Dysgonomonas sp.]|nr:hypothetical protein [Dysgonomonas sp.]
KDLSSLLRDDYIGERVKIYLDDIDADFGKDSHFLSLLDQYFYFGLLFPPIPYKHLQTWHSEREVIVWETRCIGLKEILEFVVKEDDIRKYKISGELLPGYPVTLDKYEGDISYSSADKMVRNAQLNLVYTNSGTNEWTFDLKRIREKDDKIKLDV